jgi:DNA polymerase-3 subunit epsilon
MGLFNRHVVVDVETTGLSAADGDRVIEIGAVNIQDREIVSEFATLIDPGVFIPWGVQRIHGITDEMLIGQPTPEQVIPLFNEFIRESVLVAHNAPFDLRFLRSEFARLRMRLPHRHICTLEMSRRRFPRLRDHKLETVYRHLLGDTAESGRRHRALDDARMTARIWLKMEEQ